MVAEFDKVYPMEEMNGCLKNLQDGGSTFEKTDTKLKELFANSYDKNDTMVEMYLKTFKHL